MNFKLQNLNYAPFSLYWQLQFLHVSHYTSFGRVVNKTRKNHSINFKISPMYFWRLLPLLEFQKRPNRIINKKGTEFCRFLGGKIFFCKFFLDSVFFPSVAHFKLGTGIATQNCYRNTCLVPPLVTNIKKYFLYHNN